MPPKAKTTTLNDYHLISELQKQNLSLIPEDEKIPDTEFGKVAEKTEGATVGKVVINQESKYYLLKKSGRRQQEKDGRTIKTTSADLDLKLGTKESFNEKCAAKLFVDLKQRENYLPKFVLVTSTFDPKKLQNKIKVKEGVQKVYIASEIIGEFEKVNDPTKLADNFRAVNGDQKREIKPNLIAKEDLLYNAVIMILLSNYDIKLDNFILRENDMVPIDFGNARKEESSPDVMDGIDLIRNTSFPNASDLFASKRMKSGFSQNDGYAITQKFYNQNLTPKHFLEVIKNIEENPELEKILWQHAYIYTFGTEEEKIDYANLIVARVRNLVKLKPFFEKLTEQQFKKSNLRDLIVKNETELLEIIDKDSQAKKLFYDISNIFESMLKEEAELAKMLDECRKLEGNKKGGKWQEVINKVDNFNQFLVDNCDLIEKKFSSLEKSYEKSDYISGKNQLSLENESWETYKERILTRIEEMFEILNEPLIELSPDNESYAGSENSIDDDYFGHSNNPLYQGLVSNNSGTESQEISVRSDPSEEISRSSNLSEEDDHIEFKREFQNSPRLQKCKVTWDIKKIEDYQEKLPEIMTYIQEEQEKTKQTMLPLLTHLFAHDTLTKVVQENFRQTLNPLKPQGSPSVTLYNQANKTAANAHVKD